MDQLDRECQGDADLILGARYWDIFKNQKDSAEGRKKIELAEELEKVLGRIVNSTLALSSDVFELQTPRHRIVDGVRHVFQKKLSPEQDLQPGMVIGDMGARLDQRNDQDLCVLVKQIDEDFFTQLVEGRFLIATQIVTFFSGKEDTYTPNFVSHKTVPVIVRIFRALAASTFLFGSMVTLFNLHENAARLWALSIFVIFFVLFLVLFTAATELSVYLSAAAYATFLVAFISSFVGGLAIKVNHALNH